MADSNPRSRTPPTGPSSMRDASQRKHRSRSRSRSPPRRRDNDRRGGGGGSGFRWKEKRRHDDDRAEGEKRLERGYRNRSPRRDDRREKEETPKGPRREKRPAETSTGATSVEDKFGMASKFGPSTSSSKKTNTDSGSKDKVESAPVQQATGEPMIIVHVNDRLGTKAAIPCLASDPIKLFKAQVAARIGRQPHEILLKRQGERPFKDQLTLEDYGVSNGVQIDLEIDTGE